MLEASLLGGGGGDGEGKEDVRWARRQFSSIWAPQPEAYNVGIGDIAKDISSGGGRIRKDGPILEGMESGSTFLVGVRSSSSLTAFTNTSPVC